MQSYLLLQQRYKPKISLKKSFHTGPVKGVILDWSGTTLDKYVIAPAKAFKEAFFKYDIPISMAEAREPMGLRKDLHIATILNSNNVANRFKSIYKRDHNEKDIKNIYDLFIPIQLSCLQAYTELIPKTVDTVNLLRYQMGIKVGLTTGFPKQMSDICLNSAKQQGLILDAVVAADDVNNGIRPKPFMIYKNLEIMNVNPIQSVIKVGDTVSDIEEGLNAGCWTIGVANYSNYMDINSLEEANEMHEDDLFDRQMIARKKLRDAGAHYIIGSLDELPVIIKNINMHLLKV